MKKIFLVLVVVAFGFVANAQDGQFNTGVNLGLPVGDASDFTSFSVGVEVNYLFELSEDFQLGPSLEYFHYFGSELDLIGGGTRDIDDASFLPISAAARYSVSDKFVLGANLGYGIGISPDANDGGFYYRPLVGYKVGENTMIQAAFSGVSTEGSATSSITLGVVFGL